jgi:hypothetical protein
MRKSNKISKLLDVAMLMPPLSHNHVKGQPFKPENSDVLKWLCSQPTIMIWVGQNLHKRGVIIFDSESGFWRGKNLTTFSKVS